MCFFLRARASVASLKKPAVFHSESRSSLSTRRFRRALEVSPDILPGVAIREPTEVACLLEVKMKSNRHSVSPRTRSASALEICRLLAFILFSTATFLCAQDFRATLEGDVSDPSGAGVANATVKATKLENNETKEAKTTAEGHYTIPYLNPGIYNIEVRANGFSTLKMENIVLRVADKLNLPSRLQIGGVADSVVVMAQQGVIESGSADRGLVFDPIKTQELPLNGRQTYMLMSLTPGVIFTQEAFGPSCFSGTRGWAGTASYKINGARAGQNLFLLNGAPISDAGGSWQFAPNVEAVQEFKVNDQYLRRTVWAFRWRRGQHHHKVGLEQLAWGRF